MLKNLKQANKLITKDLKLKFNALVNGFKNNMKKDVKNMNTFGHHILKINKWEKISEIETRRVIKNRANQ